MNIIETLRYSGGQVVGYAENEKGTQKFATHAMVFEVVCHHGGPKYILKIHFVAKQNADQLKNRLINALLAVSNAEGQLYRVYVKLCNKCVCLQQI